VSEQALLASFVARAQALAAEARREGRHQAAVKLCTEALEGALSCGSAAEVLSAILRERGAARLALGDGEQAVADARAAAVAHQSAQASARRLADISACA
jgi:hypothetical protein